MSAGRPPAPRRRRAWFLFAALVCAASVVFVLARRANEGPSEVGPDPDDSAIPEPDVVRAPRVPYLTASGPVQRSNGVFGRVTDAAGHPLRDVRIALELEEYAAPGLTGTSRAVAEGITSPEGEYLVGPCPAFTPTDRVTAVASSTGLAVVRRVVGAPGARVDFVLAPGGALRITVRDREDRPIAGAQAIAGALLAAAGDDGVVSFEGLPAGPTPVRVGASGYGPVVSLGAFVTSRESRELDVTLGDGFLARGEVAQQDGDPARDAQVLSRHPLTGRWEVRGTTKPFTGTFTFAVAPPPGQLEEIVAKSGRTQGAAWFRHDPAAPTASAPLKIHLVPAVRARIQGRVIDDRGAGVPGVEVFVLGMSEDPDLYRVGATTDVEGAFDVLLPLGASEQAGWLLGGRSTGLGIGWVEARASDARATFRLQGAGTLHGRAAGPNGEPLEGAVVTATLLAFKAESASPGPAPGSVALGDPRIVSWSTATRADGTWQLKGVPAGTLRVVLAWEAGGGVPITKRLALDAGGEAAVDFAVGEARTIEGWLVDERGGPIAGGTVEGVALVPVDSTIPGAASSVTSAQIPPVVADAQGHFLFALANDRATSLDLVARADGFALLGVPAVPVGRRDLRVRMTRRGSIAGRVTGPEGARLLAPATISARLLPANPRQVDGPRRRLVTTDGSFRFQDLAAGTWRIVATTERGDVVTAPVDAAVEDGREVQDLEVRLVPGGIISGTVRGASTRDALFGVTVHATLQGDAATGGRTDVTTQADFDGRYRLDGLAAGTWMLGLAFSDRPPLEDEASVELGKTVEKNFEAPSFGSIRVKVVDLDGKPVKDATVRLRTSRGSAIELNPDVLISSPSRPKRIGFAQSTDEEGINVRNDVPPGTVDVIVRHRTRQGGAPPVPVEVKAGETTEVTVTFHRKPMGTADR